MSSQLSQQPCKRRSRAGKAAVALVAAAVGGAAFGGYVLNGGAMADGAPQLPRIAPQASAPKSFASLARAVSPAVVNIRTERRVSRNSYHGVRGPGFEGPGGTDLAPFLRRFFGDGAGSRPWRGPMEPDGGTVRALGSGFIVDAGGHVVTNNHVIDGAEGITVLLQDGRKFPAMVTGRDPATDLAVLKIEADAPLPFVTFGGSDKAEVGDWVVAVGNPFGLGGSVTAGILSARGRHLGGGLMDDVLQIDAPINQGNSGGPLFDLEGRVIGVNTAILSPNGGNVGIGFAIPSRLAEPVVAALMTDGEVTRGWLGVRIQAVSETIAEAMGLEKAEGALVSDVAAGGPADTAGLQAGDVITAVDGEAIEDTGDLQRRIATLGPGHGAKLSVIRGDESLTLSVDLGRAGATKQASGDGDPADGTPRLGVTLAETEDNAGGVRVVAVDPDGPAAIAGLRRGDTITAVGADKVASADEVVRGIRGAAETGRKAVLLRLLRDGDTRFVAVDITRG